MGCLSRTIRVPLTSLLFLAVAAGALATDEANESGAWQTSLEEVSVPGFPSVRETRWQLSRGPGPYDRIQLHRYRGAGESSAAPDWRSRSRRPCTRTRARRSA